MGYSTGCWVELHASVVTAITAQNPLAVSAVQRLSADTLEAQFDAVWSVLDVRAATLGSEQRGGYQPFDNVQWMSVLKSVAAYQMYL